MQFFFLLHLLNSDFKPEKIIWFQYEKLNTPEVHIFKSINTRFVSLAKRCRNVSICVDKIHLAFFRCDESGVRAVADVQMNETVGKCLLFWYLPIHFCFERVQINIVCISTMTKIRRTLLDRKKIKWNKTYFPTDGNWKCSTKQAIRSCHCEYNEHF